MLYVCILDVCHPSSQCRLEASYAHQLKLDMIPLMMEENYQPKGWLGLILGARLWYQFWDAEQDDDAAFEHRLDDLCKEIGNRARMWPPETVQPAPATTALEEAQQPTTASTLSPLASTVPVPVPS
eukprot:COSAG01_NODE_16974_length_1189_cov_1.030275_3_plen_125_part_01